MKRGVQEKGIIEEMISMYVDSMDQKQDFEDIHKHIFGIYFPDYKWSDLGNNMFEVSLEGGSQGPRSVVRFQVQSDKQNSYLVAVEFFTTLFN